MKLLITSLCLALLLAGCIGLVQPTHLAAVTPPDRRLNHPFLIYYGEHLLLEAENLTIGFTAVKQDSRCPANVDCFVGGNAQIIISLQQGSGQAQALELDTDPGLKHTTNTTTDARYQVELVTLDPAPAGAGTEMPPQRYAATLIVTKTQPRKEVITKPTATPKATATPLPTATLTPQATPLITADKVFSAPLDAPFTLTVGQTAAITDEDFKLTLRSASADSGCFTEDDCSTMQFEGTLAMQKGDQKSLLDATVGFHADQPFTTDFAGYTIALMSVKKHTDGSLAAIFMISNTAMSQPEQPPATFAEHCPDLSQADAEAFLQEAVQDQAVTNLRFGPVLTENEDAPGLCGYVSTAYTADHQPDPKSPHLATAIEADHAVVAAKLTSDDIGVILQLANMIHAANPDNESFNVDLLQAMLASGDGEGLLERLHEMAQGSQTLHTKMVAGVQENALWLWQEESTDDYFAVLLAYDGEKFTLVAALLGDQTDESSARRMATALIQKTEPTATPTRQPTPEATPVCDFITHAEAAAILGEPVHDEPTPGDEVCGYDSIAHKLPSTDNPQGDPLYFAVAGIFDQSKAPEYLMNLADGLHKENPNSGILPYATVKGLLYDGLIAEAFKQLPALAKGSKTLHAQTVTDIGANAIWLWGPIDGNQVTTLVALDQSNNIIAVFAQANPQRNRLDLQAQMAVVARKLVARAEDDHQTEPLATPEATAIVETTPTPVATTDFEAGCQFLSQADAIAILGEPVTNAPDGEATLCGYGGVAQKLAEEGKLSERKTTGVAAGVLSDQAMNQLLLRLTDALQQDNPQGDENAYRKLKTLLMAGMTADVIAQLDKLVVGSPSWKAGGISDLGKFGVWLSKTTDTGDRIILVLAPRQDAGTVFILAQMKGARAEQRALDALITAAAKLTR